MKILGPLFVAVLICTWIAGRPATADDWWWSADADKAQRSQSPAKKAFNPLAPIDAGVKGIDRGLKKLGSDTKRFFSNTGEALRWKRPAKPPTQTEEKSSWLGSFFHREQPRPSSSVEDFLGAGRLDP
jgi:hypothetical protein